MDVHKMHQEIREIGHDLLGEEHVHLEILAFCLALYDVGSKEALLSVGYLTNDITMSANYILLPYEEKLAGVYAAYSFVEVVDTIEHFKATQPVLESLVCRLFYAYVMEADRTTALH